MVLILAVERLDEIGTGRHGENPEERLWVQRKTFGADE